MKGKRFAVSEEMTGDSIRLIRMKLGLTQNEFAQLMNTSKPTIERWESGKKPVHGPVTVLAALFYAHPELQEKLELPEKSTSLRLWYMYREIPCTVIDVDEIRQIIRIKNYVNDYQYRAFGRIEEPDYKQYEDFLESRCFPRQRNKMKLMLRELDLPFYDPFLIIQKTEGRMAEDEFWIKIEQAR